MEIRIPIHGVPSRLSLANWGGKSPSLAAAQGISAVTSVHPFSAPMPEMTAVAATSLPTQAACPNMVWKAATKGVPLPTKLWWETRPMTAAVTNRYRMALKPGAQNRGPTDVLARVLHPAGGDRGALHADEGEQGHAGGDADPAVEAAPGGVEGAEVGRLHEEPAHHADHGQGQELEDDGGVLEPGHLAHADDVDDGRDPQSGHGDADVGPGRWGG